MVTWVYDVGTPFWDSGNVTVWPQYLGSQFHSGPSTFHLLEHSPLSSDSSVEASALLFDGGHWRHWEAGMGLYEFVFTTTSSQRTATVFLLLLYGSLLEMMSPTSRDSKGRNRRGKSVPGIHDLYGLSGRLPNSQFDGWLWGPWLTM